MKKLMLDADSNRLFSEKKRRPTKAEREAREAQKAQERHMERITTNSNWSPRNGRLVVATL